ncbi:acyl-CoA binding protein [Annulohypoxylon stygium]|nr:acyl-CoA binding protein [Annulohypoxylon stygium]
MADSVGMSPENQDNQDPPSQSTTPIINRPFPLPALLISSQSIIPSLIESPPSVDRVFVHALNTVKKIPKTGASRPPPGDRLRLYGLYKQAMEGDVDGVMERPERRPGMDADELERERDKWDAWNAQSGLSRTEAKRRYIEALIETMHRYATTPDGKGLVAELEFVWDQIKNNSPSSSNASPKNATFAEARRFQEPLSGTEGPMKMLSPMSEDDAAEQEYREKQDDEGEEEGDGEYVKKGDRWSRKVERAVVRLSAEVAALREQITVGREWRSKKEKSFSSWAKWMLWIVTKHLAVDMVVLGIVLLWMRRRKDRRLEDHVRAMLRLGREYARKILPSR